MQTSHSGIEVKIFKIKVDEESATFIQAIEKIGNQLSLGV